MNNLGGMVFIVAGIALGYWVMTGKAANFLQAVQGQGTTQQQSQTQQNPWWKVTPPPGSLFQFLNTQQQYPTTGPSTNNVSQNVPSNWVSI